MKDGCKLYEKASLSSNIYEGIFKFKSKEKRFIWAFLSLVAFSPKEYGLCVFLRKHVDKNECYNVNWAGLCIIVSTQAHTGTEKRQITKDFLAGRGIVFFLLNTPSVTEMMFAFFYWLAKKKKWLFFHFMELARILLVES